MILLENGARVGGRFKLLERIGDGGHAEVWAAWDESAQQRIALKFLHPNLCSASEALVVLRHEAQMARRLAHPGVLRTEEPIQDGNRVFLPMEHAAGGDLKRLRGASYLESVPVLIRVATVLAHAHGLGIVHRDIKPGNVLFDAEGNVRLADFGTSALSGSRQTLAAGSPFSASPQQLLGEPASSSDDVYGLGALAYELLGGYPPYYPDAAPAGVLDHMPVPVRPAVPAPPRLTRLVMAMLARDASARPQSMAEVIDELGEALADTLSLVPEGAAMISERALPGASPPPKSRMQWHKPVLALAGASALAALAYLAIRGGMLEIEAPATRPPAVAAVSAPEVAPEAQTAEEDPVKAFDQELAAARLALSRGQSALARMAFERARQLRADAPEIAQGMAAVARLDRVLALHTQGVQAEAAGQFSLARDRYAAALAVDARFEPAIEGVKRVNTRLDEKGRVAAEQARQAERMAQNRRDQQVGQELEVAERWRDAQILYQATMDRDPTARFAHDGLERARKRATLATQLEDFITRSQRLSDRDVRRSAEQALAAGRRVQPAGSVLAGQLSRLASLLAAQGASVRVEITSDSSTYVRIGRVGELGRFMSRKLDLPPGSYTIVGTREGYRDVRLRLTIEPGQRTAIVAVECNEPI